MNIEGITKEKYLTYLKHYNYERLENMGGDNRHLPVSKNVWRL